MRRRSTTNRLLASCLVAVIALPTAAMGDTCLSQPQLAGVIFGSVGATLVICITIATIFWMWLRRSDQKEKGAEGNRVAKEFNDIESKTYDDIPPKTSSKNQMNMIDSLKLPRRKHLDTGGQKAFSVENVNEASGNVGVLLKAENAAGFGMNIQGSMNEGIYVKTVVPMGAAHQTGNILPGDRIKSLTINFDNMVYEDALTLLSYASPYKVKFELERKVETPPPMDNDDISGARIHPLFRSNTLTHIHFNPLGATRPSSVESPTHEAVLPKVKEKPEKENEKKEEEPHKPKPEKSFVESKPPELEPSAVISEVANSTTIADTDLSKMESSDYASDNTSEYRESENEGCGNGNQPPTAVEPPPPPPSPPLPVQEPLIDCTVVTDMLVEKASPSMEPVSPKVEFCKALPPKAKPPVARSPSPKVKPAPPKASSPAPLTKACMLRKSREDCSKPSQMMPPVKRNLSNGRIPSARSTETSAGPPEFVESRVSRIPKRTDSVKTPIIERKLPPLPKSVTQRSHSAEEKGREDVWSRLYTDKRNMLRKTRDVDSTIRTSTAEITTAMPSPLPSPSGQLRPPTDFRFSALDAVHRERLAANQAILDRQTEELRQLGVL
ncbi:PDZ domain-containing protein [Trichostrongylus colubriformis]|uniref:PDZ domain-containing protein n=1 Tax=Trichostrongylus colubriformis TaxID=6319 RepID=A0AAN8EZ59_TRICO